MLIIIFENLIIKIFLDFPDNAADKPVDMPCTNEEFKVNLALDWMNCTPYEVVKKLLPDNFFKLIKAETNLYANQMISAERAKGPLQPHGISAKWVPVTLAELKSFFAIVIHMGLLKKATLREYWSTKPVVASPFAKNLLSRNRWCAISSFLHFSDSTGYIPRGEPGHDALYKLRPIIDPLIESFLTAATPGRQIALDEAMCAFRGRVHFRVYNSNKPDKWGIKLYQASDSKTGYTMMFEIYCGIGGTTNSTVMRVMDRFLDNGHTLYMDRYYNSITLTEELLSRNTQVVGTVQTNRKGLPPAIKNQKLKRGEIISFRRDRILCLKWRDKRDVTMISTIHDDSTLPVQRRGEAEPVQKPACVVNYNEYMGGVDHSDQLLSYYPFKRKTLKWYKKLFYRLFYLTITNAQILYAAKQSELGQPHMTLHQFLEAVAEDLAVDGGQDLDQPPAPNRAARLVERHFPQLVPETTKKNATRRCTVCASAKARKETRYYCPKCDVGLCVVGCFEKYHTLLHY